MKRKLVELVISECVWCPHVRVIDTTQDGSAIWECSRFNRRLVQDKQGEYSIPSYCDLDDYDENEIPIKDK